MLDEFYRQNPQAAQAGGAFQFEALRRELDGVNGGANWAQEFNTAGPQQRIWEIDDHEHALMEESFKRGHAHPPPGPWANEFLAHPPPNLAQQMKDMPPELNEAFQKHFDWASQFAGQQTAEGKGKARADDWDQQFAAMEQGLSEEEMNANLDKAMDQQDIEFAKQFEDVWKDVRDQMGLKDTDEADLANDELRRWENEFGDFDGTSNPIGPDGIPNLGEYVFEPNNPFMDHSDPLAEGIAMLERGESLSEAALAFEAACQKEPNNAEAWSWLGNTQAQNEKEEPAIKALEKCIDLDHGNLKALMALSVSYTNEGYDHAAYTTLERWIVAKYPDIQSRVAPPPKQDPNNPNPWADHERVTKLFIEAARSAPSEGMDADVQVGLGVLFYGNSDYDKAVDCFQAALTSRPNDPTLLNRVGATMANSGSPEAAIDYYYKALEVQPQNMRVRFNLSVAYMNIGCYKEAADLLIEALQMYKGRRAGSEHKAPEIWNALRKACLCLGRQDLASKCYAGSDIDMLQRELS